ncbi:MAG: OmpW family protein [Flavobacterium sp.]|nr:OmpW family protein [Flavobacterium sp.]
MKKADLLRWKVRVRGVGVVPEEKSTIKTIGGKVDASNELIPELDFTYFFTKNIAAELILGTSKHDISTIGSDISAVGGATSANVDLGSVRLLPPTLTVQYHFNQSCDNVLKPYLGAGLNYTIFYDVKQGDVVKGITYKNALGYAAQAGFDLMITDTFFINADLKQLFLKTDVTVDASNLAAGLSILAKVELNPWVFGMGFGMKF